MKRTEELNLTMYFGSILAAALLTLQGCGYVAHSILPGGAKTICVDNFSNKIDTAAETGDGMPYRGYRQGLEMDITNAVVDRFIYDGNLKVVKGGEAELILKGELVEFKKEGLRYDKNDNVEEYRVRLVVNMTLEDPKKKEAVWTEKNFSGESTYRTTGSLAKSESAAIDDAVSDLARRIVERTVEEW
jgi:hypothetical protein